MLYVSVKINTKDKQNAINYLKNLVGSVSYIKYSAEDDTVTISDSENHDEIIKSLSSFGTILRMNESSSYLESVIDEMFSESSDIKELSKKIYQGLGITVRRRCDERFASMISSFVESKKPVCISTIEETNFSPNNLKTFIKACDSKGIEPFEFIEGICRRYTAINKEEFPKQPIKLESQVEQQTVPEADKLEFFINDVVSQSSDIKELSKKIYQELGITVRRRCDERFASMISSFVESKKPVCISTIEETNFSPNNLKTFIKACDSKGIEPFEFIEKLCDAINKESDKYLIQQSTQEVGTIVIETDYPKETIKVERFFLKNNPQTKPVEIKPTTAEPVIQAKPAEIEDSAVDEQEPEIDEEPAKHIAIKMPLKSIPKAPEIAPKKSAQRINKQRKSYPNDFDELPATQKMARIRNNYNIVFKSTALKKQVVTLQSALEYLSPEALEILSLAVAEEPDIEKGRELIEAEARRKERGDIGYQMRQVYLRLKKIFEASSEEYPVKDPIKTFHYFQQLCANQDSYSLMRMISHNLAMQDRVKDAIDFCNEVDGKKNRTNVYTEQNRQTDSLIKELNSVEIAKMILAQIRGESVYSDTDFMKTLEKTMDRNNIKTGQIWLGRDSTGQADILLSDVWYDKNLAITSFLHGMLKQ